MTDFAKKTQVPVEKTRAEIETMLMKFGADAFTVGWEGSRAAINFRYKERHLRFVMILPDKNSKDFRETRFHQYTRTESAALKAWEQACRARWRALSAVIKAKLVAIEAGITTFEEEFLSKIVMPNNQTVFEAIQPAIAEAYRTGIMPRNLLGLPEPEKELDVIDVG